jgi:putative 4-mercaptohistidine N1-methyltranferase
MNIVYETEKLLAEYLLFHYGSDEEILHWSAGPREALRFPVRTTGYFSEGIVERVLDVGCAVGRSTFEMCRNAKEAIGIDFSQAFIDAADQLARGKNLSYERLEEAGLVTTLEARIEPGPVSFEVGDAMNLRTNLGQFDRVHAANLVCRLPEPRKFLRRLPDLVKAGGELVLATPCTWLEEFTAKENWPVGNTREWLVRELSEHFELIETGDEPFLIRETARKFQWTVSMVTKWRRC